MRDAPTVLAVSLVPIQAALDEYGIDFRALARRAGVDPDLAARPNARHASTRMQKLWVLAAQESGDPLFGLRVGSHARPAMFHALGLGIMSSSSIVEALRRIERYSGVLSTNGRLVVVERGDLVCLEARPAPGSFRPTPETFDALIVALCRLLVVFAGPAAVPSNVRLPHPAPAGAAEAYRDALGCPAEFDADHLSMAFDAIRAATRVPGGNPMLAAEADRLAERYLAQVEPDSAAARVRALLMKAMPSGRIDQDGIARALNQSTSTLQRRLRDEGTTYLHLLDATRKELALEYLREGRHSLADITFLLGFADQSNFTRAFRRWTGKTPRQFLS